MKRQIWLIVLLTIPLLAACSLGAGEDDADAEPTDIAFITPLPTFEQSPTSTPRPTSTPNDDDGDDNGDVVCTPRTDWITYTVEGGDTLGDIARRAGTTSAALQDANCITNPNLISVGQRIVVPRLPTARVPTSTPVPDDVALAISPVVRLQDGWNVVTPGGTLTITLLNVPSNGAEVRFYTVPTARSLIGRDNTVINGSASITWRVPNSSFNTRIVAEVFNSAGASLNLRDAINILTDESQVVEPVGEFYARPILAGDAGNLSFLRDTPIEIRWENFPSGTTTVRFLLMDNAGSDTEIGVDDNLSDGAMLTWTVPPNLGATLGARAFDATGDQIGRSFTFSVFSGPSTGEGCVVQFNEATNFFDEPHDPNQAAVGSFNSGDQVEVMGRSLGGWYAFDPDGSSLNSIDELVWVPVTANLNEVARCN